MRRREKAVPPGAEVEAILARAQVCRLGLCDDGQPYVVPVCFGYEPGMLYVHGAAAGRKLEILASNPRVSFEMDVDCELVRGERPCDWTMRYRSVVGFGRASLVGDPAGRRHGLAVIMRHYGAQADRFEFPDTAVERTAVIRIDIDEMTGKQSGY